MARYGRYETLEELYRTPSGSVARATRSESAGPTVVKVFEPDPGFVSAERLEEQVAAFVAAAGVQQSVAAAGSSHWAPIHEFGRVPGGAFYVTTQYPLSAQKLITGKVRLQAPQLFALANGVVKGLQELKRWGKRSHGNLKPSNVLLTAPGTYQALLSDPLDDPGAGSESGDLYALGRIIYQLVMQQIDRGAASWPIPVSPAWAQLGPTGNRWRELCNRLLHPSPEEGVLTLDSVAHELSALAPGISRRRLARATAGAVVTAAAILGGFGIHYAMRSSGAHDTRIAAGAMSNAVSYLPTAGPTAPVLPTTTTLPADDQPAEAKAYAATQEYAEPRSARHQSFSLSPSNNPPPPSTARPASPGQTNFAVLVPVKRWFAPSQPDEIRNEFDRDVTLGLTHFDGTPVEARVTPALGAGQMVDLKTVFPQVTHVGTYLLTASLKGAAPADFLGTPLILEVRDGRQAGDPMVNVTEVRPLQYAVMNTKAGQVKMMFYYDVAPNTVDAFIELASEGFYDGLTFHRVVPGFVIQGGDPKDNGTGGPGYHLGAELSDRKHEPGVLSMARTDSLNSAGSQFFVCLDYNQTSKLDKQYTAFGRVTAGMDAVNGIAAAKLSDAERGIPETPQVIESIRIEAVTSRANPYTTITQPTR
jgi:peptidyl-prolyl cis-trans isomerase B (cyclophilin B)